MRNTQIRSNASRQTIRSGGARSSNSVRTSGRHSSGSAKRPAVSSQGRGPGRQRVVSNAEKQAIREKRIRAMKRKKARQRAYTYRAIVFGFLVLCIFMVWKGVTGITSYIDNSRQEKVNAMQDIEIYKGNSSIDVAGETFAAEASVPEATAADTSDPTHVLSNGRYVDTTKPMVALTWDDGPNGSTGEAIMDVLEANNGRGTFFIVGERIDKFASEVQRMAANGHEIANHSWDHDEKLSKMDSAYISSEFEKTNAKVQELTGITPTLARLPGGIISDEVKSTLTMPLIFWSVDTLDWKSRNAGSVADIIRSEVKDGDIVLMHELYASTQAACEEVIPWLAQQGYQLVTVSELIQFRNAEVAGGNGKQYSSFPPTETVAETTAAPVATEEAAVSADTQSSDSGSKSEATEADDDDEETTSAKKSTTKAQDEEEETKSSQKKSETTTETAAASNESSNTEDVIEAPDAVQNDTYTPTEAAAAQAVTETAWWMAPNSDSSGNASSDSGQADAIQAIDAPG